MCSSVPNEGKKGQRKSPMDARQTDHRLVLYQLPRAIELGCGCIETLQWQSILGPCSVRFRFRKKNYVGSISRRGGRMA